MHSIVGLHFKFRQWNSSLYTNSNDGLVTDGQMFKSLFEGLIPCQHFVSELAPIAFIIKSYENQSTIAQMAKPVAADSRV